MSVIGTMRDRVGWHVVAVAVACAGMVHIAATLMVPQLATRGGAQVLAATLPPNKMQVLPAVRPEAQPLPFMNPDMRLAVCHYDISAGPVAISALLPDKGWSLGLYTLGGSNFYAVPAQDLQRGEVNLLLVPPSQRAGDAINFGRRMEATSSEVTAPQPQGLIVIRAALNGHAYVPEVEAQLARASCAVQRPKALAQQ